MRANGLSGEYVAIASLSPTVNTQFKLVNLPLNFITLLPGLDSSFVNRSLETFDTDSAFDTLESNLGEVFAAHLGIESRAVSLREAQQRLLAAEVATGRRTGGYLCFLPAAGRT
ncbi:MAG: hypothetical protein HC838_13755 [Spirulinaceae cyanobacterium RM2_2_10]|nr:hypothetical protein [Spirulinaceae cyanobacterium RM2_2_10]